LKKQGVVDPIMGMKKALKTLTIKQLKILAERHHIKVKGQIVESRYYSYRKAPTKQQYINKLSGIVTEADLYSIPK